ncbi:hypothetical protein Dimus_015166 [Dionaea muscipula]
MTKRVFASLFSYESFELSARFEFSPCYKITVSDPCHGIFCVHVTVDVDGKETRFLLWNPAIREIELLPSPLPPPVPEQEDFRKFLVHAFGFGYDPDINDCKVFVIFEPLHGRSRPHGVDWPVEVYNLREGYWKFLPQNSFHESMGPSFDDPLPMILNGNMCNWFNRLGETKIISFDLSKEIFLETKVPAEWREHLLFCPQLLQPNKMDSKPRILCCSQYLHHPNDKCDIEIWELVEYGSSRGWIKQIVLIEFPILLVPISEYYRHLPLGYWQDEEALILQRVLSDDDDYQVIIGRPLLTYNSATKEFKSTGFEHTLELSRGCAYIESLISVKELCRRHNQQEHRPQDDSCLATIFSVREVNAPELGNFPCSRCLR